MIDVTVGDHDAGHLVEAASQPAEALLDGGHALVGAEAGVEQQDAAPGVLDEVEVHRAARLRERHRDRNPVDSEVREVGLGHRAYFEAFTFAASSGSTLNRSPTSP